MISITEDDRRHWPPQGARLIAEGAGDLVAFGPDHIANPDLAERIRLGAPLNRPQPEYF
jgi:N-ethylmaleimide reductase